MPEKEIVFSVKNLSKSYNGLKVLDKVSMELKDGEVFGLLGPNGAGKSTLTKIAIGLLEPDSGSVSFYGKKVYEFSQVNKFFGVVPQDVSCFYDFTVKQNLGFFGSLYKLKKDFLRKRIDFLLKWLDLKRYENKRVAHLSGGYRRMLNIACALVHDPDIIFMDEPTVGLDPKRRQSFWKKITELKDQGKSICLTTHYMDEAQELCDRVAMIDAGKKLVEGMPSELIKKFGGVRILILRLSKPLEETLLTQLQASFLQSLIQRVGKHLIISFRRERALQKISELSTWIMAHGFGIESTVIKEPELEDVFINLTGRRVTADVELR